MLKNRTSLIIVSVFIGILICYFTICNCKMNYGLIEGMATPSTAGAPPVAGASAPHAPPAAGSSNPLSSSMATAANMGVNVPSVAPAPAAASAQNKPKVPATASTPSSTVGATDVKESFTPSSKPIEYGSLQESKSDDWNLSKWVKDAMRYAKGMGNENRLDSYQYNSGPQIPLPEGEMFLFKDTKFSPQCCPGTYSSSLGCACLSKPQFNYLVMRGGNNTVPSGRKTSYYNEY